MTIIESNKKEEILSEDMDVTFDKVRKIGSLSGWQRLIYNFIFKRLGETYLLKVMNLIHDKAAMTVPDGTDPEEIKKIIKLALIDYVDSTM